MHRNTWSYTYCISIEWEETRQISTAFYQTKENKTLSLIVRGRMAKATCDNQSFLIESSQVLLYFHLHFHLQLSELVHMKNSKTNEISKQQKSEREKIKETVPYCKYWHRVLKDSFLLLQTIVHFKKPLLIIRSISNESIKQVSGKVAEIQFDC